MQISLLKSKIHRAKLTGAELHYEGSLAVDKDLIKAANFNVYEKVQVVNVNNGERFETYIIEAPAGSGEICLKGAAARLGYPGDILIIMSFALFTEEEAKIYKPVAVYVDQNNKIV